MRTSLTPVFEKDIEALKDEFFRPSFATQNLGESKWIGPGVKQSDFSNPVTFESFQSWLRDHSFGTQKDPDPTLGGVPLAWRSTFEVGHTTTTIWALGSDEVKSRLENVHSLAVGATFDWLQKGFVGTGHKSVIPTFQSGVGENQIPYLHTDAFILNHELQYLLDYPRNSKATVEALRSRIDVQYVIRFGPWREMEIGAVDQSPETDVQRRLFKGFKTDNEHGKFYEGKGLFIAWRQEAKRLGWDAERVESVLDHAAELREEKLEAIKAEQGPLHKIRAAFSEWLHQMTTPGSGPEKDLEKLQDKDPHRSR
jgi:hypothetical protein